MLFSKTATPMFRSIAPISRNIMAAASEATTTNRYLPHSGQRIITASNAMRIGKLIALYLNTLDSFRYFSVIFPSFKILDSVIS